MKRRLQLEVLTTEGGRIYRAGSDWKWEIQEGGRLLVECGDEQTVYAPGHWLRVQTGKEPTDDRP